MTEWWAYRFAENPNLEVVEDDDFDMDEHLRRAEELAAEEEADAARAAPPPPEDWEDI